MTDPNIVFMAFIMTLGIVVSITIYAFKTKRDFTIYGGTLFIISYVF